MEITVYSIPSCSYCTHLAELMRRANQTPEYIGVGVVRREFDGLDGIYDGYMSKKDFKAKFPNAPGYPWVIIDGEEIGGLYETATFFVKNNLVSSKKR